MGKAVWTIMKGVVYITVLLASLLLIIYVCSGCGKKAADPPLQYEGRMKFAGWSLSEKAYAAGIWIDTETGVCYATIAGIGNGLTVMVDREGKPYIANGWRDYGSDD